MQTQLFISSNVPAKDQFIEAIDVKNVSYIDMTNSNELATYFNNTYTRIGFAWDNKYSYIPFGVSQYYSNGYAFTYFSRELVDYLTLYNNLNVPIIVDFITCSLNNTRFVYEHGLMKKLLKNITIEYSINRTGSVIGSDWIMESNNQSIKNNYFNDKINNYKYTLGNNSYSNAMITYDGSLYVCGFNRNAELGLGYASDFEPTFKRVTLGFPLKETCCDETSVKESCNELSVQTLSCDDKFSVNKCLDDCTLETNKLCKVTSISIGASYGGTNESAMAAICDGSLYMCGINGFQLPNQSVSYLGVNIFTDFVTVFTKVTTGLPQDKKVVAVSCGGDYTMAVMEDGTLYAVGRNFVVGQLGFGLPMDTTFSTFTQVPLPTDLKVVAVSCGEDSVGIIVNDGKSCINSLYTCGGNASGQLGLGDFVPRSVFTKVTSGFPQDVGVACVSAGYLYMGIVLNDGTVYTTGDNSFGGLGNGTLISQNSFAIANSGLPDGCGGAIAISCGPGFFTDVLLQNGSLYVCGIDFYTTLGQGSAPFNFVGFPSFKQVTLGIPPCRKVVAINANYYDNSIILDDGSMYTCGINSDGTLGQAIQDSNAFSSTFSKVKCVIEQATLVCTKAVSMCNWDYTFLIDMKLPSFEDVFTICRPRHNITIISNYQSYKLVIKNKKTGCVTLSHDLFKNENVYEIKLIDNNNCLVKDEFKVMYCKK
jgi:alpha-tubulin suppressor-like RCC1 family protein